MRTVILSDAKLEKILGERGVIYKEIGELNKQMAELDKERQKLAMKMERLKEKTEPIIEKLSPSCALTEFEVINSVYLNADQKPEVSVVDRIEEFKNLLREEKV